jgi:formylglycine-generating enzyme required for sulfatase activity
MKKKSFRSISLVVISTLIFNITGRTQTLNSSLIENSVTKVSDKLYAGKFEVSNWMYRQFLNDLRSENKTSDLRIAQIDSAGWIATPINIEPFVKIYHTSSKFDDYPVVNISYEAANLYCAWLTRKYNSLPGRKYSKVRFVLPSEKEWTLVAKSKNKNPVYATGGSLKNNDGVPLANYKRTDIPPSKDNPEGISADILTPVKSYWKNELGIYNLSGNAAEMVSEKGIAKGGSFLDTDDKLKIESKLNYKNPSCDLGFRYLMKIVTD